MRTRLLTLALLLTLGGCPAHKTDPSLSSVGIAFKPTGPKSKRAATRNQCYDQIARQVLRRVGELRQRHRPFAHIDPEDLSWQSPVVTNERLWIAFRYDHAVTLVEEGAESKGELRPKPKSFSDPEGLALRVYFFTGPWRGEADVPLKVIEEMKVAYFLEAADLKLGVQLRKELDRILDEEAARQAGQCRPEKRRAAL
jgi:hypothetical protein